MKALLVRDLSTVFFGGMTDDGGVIQLDSWQDALTAPVAVEAPCISFLFTDCEDGDEGIVTMHPSDGRMLVMGLLRELAKSGDPTAEKLRQAMARIIRE